MRPPRAVALESWSLKFDSHRIRRIVLHLASAAPGSSCTRLQMHQREVALAVMFARRRAAHPPRLAGVLRSPPPTDATQCIQTWSERRAPPSPRARMAICRASPRRSQPQPTSCRVHSQYTQAPQSNGAASLRCFHLPRHLRAHQRIWAVQWYGGLLQHCRRRRQQQMGRKRGREEGGGGGSQDSEEEDRAAYLRRPPHDRGL
jgi:hypothetical protein